MYGETFARPGPATRPRQGELGNTTGMLVREIRSLKGRPKPRTRMPYRSLNVARLSGTGDGFTRSPIPNTLNRRSPPWHPAIQLLTTYCQNVAGLWLKYGAKCL